MKSNIITVKHVNTSGQKNQFQINFRNGYINISSLQSEDELLKAMKYFNDKVLHSKTMVFSSDHTL